MLNLTLRHLFVLYRSTTHYKSSRGILETEHNYLGDAEAEALLRKNEFTRTLKSVIPAGSAVSRFDNNWVQCNASFEDRHAESFLAKSVLKSSETLKHKFEEKGWTGCESVDNASLKLFSVIDGHLGSAVADLLKVALHPAIALSLARTSSGYELTTENPLSAMRQCEEDLATFLSEREPFGGCSFPQEGWQNLNQDTISAALTSAFLELDYQICSEPLRLISNIPSALGTPDPKAVVEPAISGACAITVMVDEDRQEVYVANTGDTRAVAGYWIPPQTTRDGRHYQGGWRCEVLTEDHNSINPLELQRYVIS